MFDFSATFQGFTNSFGGFENINPDIVGYIVAAPFVFIRIGTILFTAKDISHRTNSIFYQLACILLVTLLTPFVGFPLYFIIRPYRTLDDIDRKDTINSLGVKCIDCGEVNNYNNEYCVSCGDYIKIECKECKKKYDQTYNYCPFCGAPNIENN